jgi:erythronate-4-phosphate dehydrogenase
MRVVEYDPPRSRREKEFISAPLSETLASDIITLHLPLTSEGEDATERMVDSIFLDRLRQGTILFNTSRGGVVSSDALIAALRSGRLGAAVLDVWEGEPAVPRDLVELCAIATPHIAGYSFDGKVRGTAMMADALARFLGRENDWRMESVLPENAGTLTLSPGLEGLDGVHAAVRSACDIVMDDEAIRDLLPLGDEERRSGFDRLRRSYRQRREFPAYTVSASDPVTENVLQRLGFRSARRAVDAGLR